MTELSRAEHHALLMTTRTPGWFIVKRVLDKLVEDAVNNAMDCTEQTAFAKTQRAGGARDLVAEFNKIVAGLPDQISETGSD